MFVIVETSNKDRGDDAVRAVYGLYQTEALALEVCANMRASLPGWVESHEDYDIDFGVMMVRKTVNLGETLVKVAP